MRRRKLIIAGMAALAAVSMIGGTWAVWTQTLAVRNEFMTAKYSTFLREKFESPKTWLPGEEEEKAVWVENQSTIPVIAKITMTQNWERMADVTATRVKQETLDGHIEVDEEVVAKAGEKLGDIFQADDGSYQYAAIWNLNTAPGEEVMVLASKRASDPGLRMPGITEVSSIEEAAGHWLMLDESPDQLGRYTFYYIGEVAAGGRTPDLLKSVTMNPLLKATVTGTRIYFEKMEDGTYRKLTEDTIQRYTDVPGGYDNCRYTLSVTMDTVQATPAALKSSLAFKDEIGEYLSSSGYIRGLGYDGSDTPGLKVMTLVENGYEDRLSYVPSQRTSDGEDHYDPGSWFMSFTNMVPGESYTDTLKIKNDTTSGYTMYMRIVPKADGELGTDAETIALKRELLERIYMEVYYLDADSAKRLEERTMAKAQFSLPGMMTAWAAEGDAPLQLRGTLLYRGTSTGIYSDTDAKEDTLRNLIPLGHIGAQEDGTVYVRLTLDPTIGLESETVGEYGSEPAYKYADLLTKVDWEFLIQGDSYNPGNPPGPGGTPTPGNTPPGNPVVDIPEGDVPLTAFDIPDGDVPLAEFIPDGDVPLAFLAPATGDERPLVPVLVTVLAALGLMCVFGVLAFGDRKKEQRG